MVANSSDRGGMNTVEIKRAVSFRFFSLILLHQICTSEETCE